jgi:HK97 family phage major capsid protein
MNNNTVSQTQADLTAKRDQAVALLSAQDARAKAENRERTPGEIAAIDALIDEGKAIRARLDRANRGAGMTAEIERITAGLMGDTGSYGGGRSLGSQFVDNHEFREWVKSGGHRRSGAIQSPAFDLLATTLDESGGSGGPLVIPQLIPGITPLPMRKLVVSDLLAQGTTTSNAVTFLAETTFTNAAAATAEGALKPESTLVFTATTELVRKISTTLPVTDEILEDFQQMRSYTDGRLRLAVQITEDDELLNGSGVAPHLTGLLTRAGLAATVVKGADSPADAIAKQIGAIAATALLQPDGIIMHPTNWLAIQLSKNLNGDYYGNSGPFTSMVQPTLWGLPVALTPAIALGTALVGAFKAAAQVFRTTSGLRVEISNSHNDDFVHNLLRIRAEERLALVTYRNSAMGKVTGL